MTPLEYEAAPPPPGRKISTARLLIPVAADLSLIAFGAFLLAFEIPELHWLAAALIAVGAVLLIAQSLVLIRYWRLRRALGDRTPEQVAQHIMDQQKAAYSSPHERRLAEPRDFRKLDRRFYSQTTRELEALGFRIFGDIIDVTMRRIYPHQRTVSRIMGSEDGVVRATIVHLRVLGPLAWVMRRKNKDSVKSVRLSTALMDGTLVVTACGNSPAQESPYVRKLVRPQGTSTE